MRIKKKSYVLNSRIELGDEVEEQATGVVGIVMAETLYVTGCRQYAVQPKSSEAGKVPDAHWFDGVRLKITRKHVMDVSVRSMDRRPETGGPGPIRSLSARRSV